MYLKQDRIDAAGYRETYRWVSCIGNGRSMAVTVVFINFTINYKVEIEYYKNMSMNEELIDLVNFLILCIYDYTFYFKTYKCLYKWPFWTSFKKR